MEARRRRAVGQLADDAPRLWPSEALPAADASHDFERAAAVRALGRGTGRRRMNRPTVELGIVSTLPSTLIAIELAQIAEELGFDRVAFSDTAPLIYHAAYPAITAILMRTHRIRVGPYVTNPVSRHWSIHLANARAFEELAPGRFFLGIGTGDGAVHSVGLKPAKLSEFRAAAAELRKTLPQGTPIHMAFSGPRGMAVAGALADELTIGTGLD